MSASHPIRCRCGQFRARVAHPERGVRAICYCRDCRAYAHFLGPPDGMLDAHGGTEVVVVRPASVSFDAGADQLACMSLSPRGTLRWFTRCCGTPVGNLPRDIRLAHLGLIHSCLDQGGADLDAAFGPVRMKVNRASARGDPGGAPPVGFAIAGVRYAASMAWSRVSGGYRNNPFFDSSSGAPIAAPQVISRAERDALMARV
jgi:hypothetical protein